MQVALTLTDLDLTNPVEPRIADTKLAEALGYERPQKIRDLIKRHESALTQFGRLHVEPATTHGGTRPTVGSVFHLNRKQALFICTKSDTPMATCVTIAIVEVFEAVMARRHLPTPANHPRITYRDAYRIRSAKMRLVEAVGALDMMGIDVAAIDIGVVRDFWRRMGA